jgi:DNA invertase Pin-like site-specific DNA recombinase
MIQPTFGRIALYVRARSIELAAEQSAALLAVVGSISLWHTVAVFCDLTGGPTRPARAGALAAAQAGGFDVLLVTAADRLTRSTDELRDLIGRFTAANVVVYILDIGPQSPTSHHDGRQLPALTGSHVAGAARRVRAAIPAHSTSPAQNRLTGRAKEDR